MRKKENILDLESRRTSYNLILKNPGLHLHEISRRADIPITTLRYHLRFLEKRDLILAKSEGLFIRYYKVNGTGNNDKKILNLLRKKIIRQIVLIFYSEVITSRIEISQMLEISPNTASYYLNKLIRLGIIEPAEIKKGEAISTWGTHVIRSPIGREKLYRITDPELLWDVLVKYKKSYLDDFSSKDFFQMLMIKDKSEMPKKWKTYEDRLDSVIEAIFEFSSIPICAGHNPFVKRKK